MIRVSNIALPLTSTSDDFVTSIEKQTGLTDIVFVKIAKRSVDARQRNNIHFLYTFDVAVQGDETLAVNRSSYPHLSICSQEVFCVPSCQSSEMRPVVVGSGPAGMMAALALADAGLKPIVLERGADVCQRKKEVERFWKTGILNLKTNVQFGEGGAGAFSDGKLSTGIKKDKYVHKVLNAFVKAGAPDEILWLAKPHVGTDNLYRVVQNIRHEIVNKGGEYRFETQLIDFVIRNGRIQSVLTKNKDGETDEIIVSDVILAVGHSARDTFEMLLKNHVPMEQKAFAVGVRIEHEQSMINRMQYGSKVPPYPLGAADYKFAVHLNNGRSAYSFCMCPGGRVVASSSEKDGVVTNGMSYFARDLKNANSAFLVGVTPKDFHSDDVLAGVEFQRKMEKKAFIAGARTYAAPAQCVGDFLQNRETKSFGQIMPTYRPMPVCADLRSCLPDFVTETLRQALPLIDKKLKGFCTYDAVMTGVETRSSSPVLMKRNADTLESTGVKGLYPCGEGAGHAGGIVSAGADGLKCAEKVIQCRLAGGV